MSPPALDQILDAIHSLGLAKLVSICELPLNRDDRLVSLWVNLSIGGSDLKLNANEFLNLVHSRSAAIVELLCSQDLSYSRYVFQFVVPSSTYNEKYYVCAYSQSFTLIGESSRVEAISEILDRTRKIYQGNK